MGIYTELVLACELKEDVSPVVINTIKWLYGGKDYDSQLGLVSDWGDSASNFGLIGGDSGSFPGKAHGDISIRIRTFYCLTIRMSGKNYGGSFERFLHWLAPFSARQGFVGYMDNEVLDDPDLIYFIDGKAFLVEVDSQKRNEITPDSFR